MVDFSSINSLKAAEDACREGRLARALLLPAELGGQDCPENLVFLPPSALRLKTTSTTELINAVRNGMSEVGVVPEYRGASFVPTKISVTAKGSNTLPAYKFEIEIW